MIIIKAESEHQAVSALIPRDEHRPTCGVLNTALSGCHLHVRGNCAADQYDEQTAPCRPEISFGCTLGIGTCAHHGLGRAFSLRTTRRGYTSASVLDHPSIGDGARQCERNCGKGNDRSFVGGTIHHSLARVSHYIPDTAQAIACGKRLLVLGQGVIPC